MSINTRIRDLLKEKGKTQQELGDFAGVSQNTVSDWINKGKNPSANLMYRISDFFEVDFNYLFLGEDFDLNISELSKNEQELLDTYNRLDSRGQHRLHTIIYEEIDRMENSKNDSPKVI